MNFLNNFSSIAHKCADKAAIVDHDGLRETSYARLDELSGKAAAKLLKMGFLPGDPVMICLGRRMEYVAAYIGALKAGCVAVPVVPDYPQERLEHIRRDCEAVYVIRDDFFSDIEAFDPAEPVILQDGAPAVLVYTSGSTGKPKGIPHSVRSVADAVRRSSLLLEDLEPIAFGATAPLSFVAFVLEYLSVLNMGGCSHILEDSVRRDMRLMEAYFEKHGISCAFISPQMLKLYRGSNGMKRVIAGSEALKNAYSESYTIYNAYGMSETLATAMYFVVDKPYENTPIGKPAEGVELFLLDENGNEAAKGQEGEICLLGYFAEGYLHQNSDAFVKQADGRVLLHTGDIGRLNENGDLVYLNRRDWMVKINGQRVETGEIESRLCACRGVTGAAVKAFDDAMGQKYLAAYYTAQGSVAPAALAAELKKVLPKYMLPRYYKRLEKMPVNANGKLDRLALLPPEIDDYKSAYAAPENELQAALCGAIEKLLDCGRVGVDDDFFSLGGDSIKVLALISDSGMDELTPDMILRGRTVRGICALLGGAGKTERIAHKAELSEFYPLTEAQLGVYLQCVEEPQSMMYNIPMCCELGKNIDPERFASAVKAALEKHSALGVRIGKAADGTPGMMPADFTAQVPVKPVERLEDEIKAFIRPFDIENEPLFRAEIVKTANGNSFLFDIHHLVFDGSSVKVLLEDAAKAYDGGRLADEELTIFDISEYEKTLKQSERYKAAQDYFDKLLSGVDTDSRPIRDHVGASLQKGAGRIVIPLGAELAIDHAENFSKERGITEGTLFLGAFAYTLAKFNGANEALFCTVNSGRHDPRLNGAIGMFVKTLPFYMRTDKGERVVDYLERTQKLLFEEMGHDCISFAELARNYAVRPDISFVYQSELLRGALTRDGAIEARSIETGSTQFDISVMVLKTKNGYELSVDYRTELYSAAMMRGFADMLIKVASELMTAERMGDISFVSHSAAETLALFNLTARSYEVSDIVTMFRRQAKAAPDNTAVICNERTLTYRELDDLSDRIAACLAGRGIGKGDAVSVLINRSEYMPVSSIGVLKSGAMYQPLDPSYPPERLEFMISDAGAKLLIADRQLMDRVPGYKGEVLFTDEIAALAQPAKLPEGPSPEDGFILLYTSGSTGTPKGVILEHRNLCNFCRWYCEYFALGADSTVAAYASYGFDANMMDTYPALTCGARVVIVPDEIRLDLAAIERCFNENGVTHSFMTTQVGRQFAEYYTGSTLKHLSVGGEKLTPIAPQGKSFTLYNVYGPTECTVLVTAFPVDRLYTCVPIGKPVANVRLYVVDDAGRLLPPGATGELWIAGRQVARSYLNRPEKNAEAFVKNPFSDDAEYSRVYKTGDAVRWNQRGEIDFVGRGDGQVKIRGFRIELTEVEGVIREFPGVADATVQAFDLPSGGKYLAAYIVCDGKLDKDALRAFILERKPPYMVPEAIMQIERIPLNQNQKVNRRALPMPERKAENAVPPQTELQREIFDIAAEVIGHGDFGVNTDLYEAGLTSIATLKLNVRLSERFKVPVKSADLKENSTVEKLERFFQGADGGAEEKFEMMADYALTKTQEGIFVESIAKADSTVYNVPLLLEISPELDTERLKKAIVAAVNAHPYIKTRLFMNENGDVRQRRLDGDFSFDENEIELIGTDRIESVAGELVKPFKLLGGRLFRVKLIKADRSYMLLEMHHVISDGTSLNILLDDIERSYRGEKPEAETFSGYEVVLNEQRLREGEYLEKAKSYYENLLDGVDTDCLPVADIRDMRPDGVAQGSLLSENVTVEDVKHFCEVNRCGMNAFFTSVFGLVLSRFNGMQQSAFAGIYNGRNDSRLARTVSMLVKTLPIVAAASNDKTIGEYVSSMNGQLLDSMANDIYSFAEISREYGAKADVMFVYQGDEMEPDSFCGFPARIVPLSLDTVKAPLNVFVYLKDNRVRWASEYNSGLYSAELMQGLLEALDKAAEECLKKTLLGDVSILTEKARRMVDGFNETDNPYDDAKTVVDLFTVQAQKTPERTAVVYENRSYTYSQLELLTRRLAQHLTAKGVGRETVTAVLIPRCEHMVICSLGVLRAGGAYLPLDPTYPPERLNLMVKDSGAGVLITTPELNAMISDEFTGPRIMTDEIAQMEELGIELTAPKPENLFVMLYTSGSTGTPKGVMLEHRNVFAFFTWYIRKTGVDENTRASSYASYGFDACMQDLYPALMCGGCVYIIPDDMRLDLNRLREYFCENGMTHAFMTTQIGRQFAIMERVPSMKLLIMGGEKLVPFAPPDYLVMNGYGPSECAMGSSMYPITAVEKDVPIGRPLDNLKMYVVDPQGRMLPPGATGELWIAGPQVSRGYLNRPEQTAAAYTANPFCSDEKHARVYHTGDMVRWLPDGNLQFIGRRDGMVKVRGFRIELTEVEEVVRRFPGIKDATVAAFDDNAGGKYLAAYLVSDSKLDIEKLKQFILAEKPPYMVPAVMMQIDAIPYTQNQKVNRRALPQPERRSGGREPANDMERRLCEFFAQALGVEKVYADDDFFEMGGTSISAAKIAMKCSMDDIPVVYKDIFDYTTPHSLSEFVRAQSGEATPAVSESEPAAQAEQSSAEHEELWSVLEHNRAAEVNDVVYSDIGSVLVTGSTGFLGTHIIRELIEGSTCRIFCLVRGNKESSAQQRLMAMLEYYFDDTYEQLLGDRLVVVEGDILDEDLMDKLKELPFDTLINCAAIVKHFTADDESDRVNFHGVENLIDICLKLNKKLIQTSTISVAGMSSADPMPVMTESMLSFGQSTDNKYINSKWKAERAVLTAVRDRGLRGKVIRLGNLMSRYHDGEFQANFKTNGFMSRLNAYVQLGCYSVNALDANVEFSSIDYTARAVLALAGTPDKFTVFHANNCHAVHMANVLEAMAKQGVSIDVVNDEEYMARFDAAMRDESRNLEVSALISYNSHDELLLPVEADNSFTVKALYHLGFSWPIVSVDYIERTVRMLIELDYFS